MADSIGLNAINLIPAGKIGIEPTIFRFRLQAPRAGTLGVRWYAQAQQLGQPAQAAIASDAGLSIAPVPSALISYSRNVAAGSDNTVQIDIDSGITFTGGGLLRIDVPTTFQVIVAEVQVGGYARLSSSPSLLLGSHSVTIQLALTDILWTGVTYSVLLRVQNPATATLPAACVDVVSALVTEQELLGTWASTYRDSICEASFPVPLVLVVSVPGVRWVLRARKTRTFSSTAEDVEATVLTVTDTSPEHPGMLASSDFTPNTPEAWAIYLEAGRCQRMLSGMSSRMIVITMWWLRRSRNGSWLHPGGGGGGGGAGAGAGGACWWCWCWCWCSWSWSWCWW